IYSENRESPAYALVLNHIGLAAEMEGDVQRAERVYKDALKISLQNNDIPLIGTLYHNIALLNLNKEKFETAEMFYLKSEKYLRGDKESVQAAILYINFAHLYIEMKDYSLAKKYLRDAEEICRKSGAEYLLPDILFNYHLLYNNLKNREKSLTYYKEFAEAEGRLISSVKRSKMDNIRTDFLINQKNEEIKELHITKKDLNSIAARYKVLIVVLFGAIILGFVVMVFFVTKTTKEKTDRKSEVEKKRKKDKTQKYSRSVLGNKEKKEIADKIEALFIEEKIFLKKNLTLTDLSEELGISRTYTSQVINEIFGKTFTKLVNEYRIREAGTLMKSDLYKIYTIESIANEVGFNSTNVFSKAFKESYGQTPSSFLRQNC
ncbi:MAG: helix-turn-helix domain-containing protein, partial [Rhodothermaceae bacterium]